MKAFEEAGGRGREAEGWGFRSIRGSFDAELARTSDFAENPALGFPAGLILSAITQMPPLKIT